MNPNDAKTQLNNQVTQLNAALAGLNKAKGTNFKSASLVTEPIKASQIGKVQAYNVPPINNAVNTNNLAQTTNQYQSQIQTTANAEPVTTASANKSKLNSYLEGIMGNISGQADAVNAINKEEDVANKKAQALTLSNDLDKFDKEYKDQIKAIKENPEGKFGGAIQQDINKAEERYQDVRANKVLSYNSALNDYQGASDIATSKIQALKDQNSQALQAYSLFADSVMNDLTASEKLQVQANIDQKQLEAKTVEDAYAQALSAGLDNGAGQSYFNALDQAKRTGNVASILGTVSQYGYQTLDQQRQRSALALDNAQISKIYKDMNTGSTIDVSNIVNDPSIPSSKKNQAVLTSIIGNSEIGQGTKTKIADILGVINATNDLASSRQSGKFSGFYPGASLVEAFVPVGLKRQKTIENEGFVDAINLKVQQWASGASLTEQQINQVNKLTPTKNETDRTLRTKLNNLNNFMLTQAQSQLQSEGVDFAPEKVNLFELSDLLKQASPEQKKQLKAQFPNQFK